MGVKIEFDVLKPFERNGKPYRPGETFVLGVDVPAIVRRSGDVAPTPFTQSHVDHLGNVWHVAGGTGISVIWEFRVTTSPVAALLLDGTLAPRG